MNKRLIYWGGDAVRTSEPICRIGPFQLDFVPVINGRLFRLHGRVKCLQGKHFWVGGGHTGADHKIHYRHHCGREGCTATRAYRPATCKICAP